MAWIAAHFARSNGVDAVVPATTDAAVGSLATLESAIVRDFPPDIPFGLGTSAPRIMAALEYHGLEVSWINSGAFGWATARARARLTAHLAAGRPAIVCVDTGRIGGPAFGAHWAIAAGISGDALRLVNVSQPNPVQWLAFLASWRCPHLPLGYNHCALLVRPTREREAAGA